LALNYPIVKFIQVNWSKGKNMPIVQNLIKVFRLKIQNRNENMRMNDQ